VLIAVTARFHMRQFVGDVLLLNSVKAASVKFGSALYQSKLESISAATVP
jgi:hypothetical protein